MKYQVKHYDDTRSQHESLDAAFQEAAKRLEPWREGTNFIGRQNYTEAEIAEAGCYVFVALETGEATEDESYITVKDESRRI